jgi:hypothetical protein
LLGFLAHLQANQADKIPRTIMKVAFSLVAIAMTVSATAQAQVREEKTMPLALAAEAAAAAVAECQAKGFAASAAVVDRAGLVKALHRADGAGLIPSIPSSARPGRRPPSAPTPAQ